jgi:hypothetical protein
MRRCGTRPRSDDPVLTPLASPASPTYPPFEPWSLATDRVARSPDHSSDLDEMKVIGVILDH